MSEVVINFPFRIVQAPISALCSMQSSGNTPSVVNSSAEGEMIEPAVDEDAQSSLAQQVDTAVPDEKAQLSTDQPSDMEVSEPSLDEHLVQDENSSLGKRLMNLKSALVKLIFDLWMLL